MLNASRRYFRQFVHRPEVREPVEDEFKLLPVINGTHQLTVHTSAMSQYIVWNVVRIAILMQSDSQV